MADKKDCGGAGKDSTVCKKMAFHNCKRNCDEVQGADTSLAYCEESSGYKVLCPAFGKRFKNHGCDAPAADDVKRCARITKAMEDRRCGEEEVKAEETAKPEENTAPEDNAPSVETAKPEEITAPEENAAPEGNKKPEENADHGENPFH